MQRINVICVHKVSQLVLICKNTKQNIMEKRKNFISNSGVEDHINLI
jgi:hypothetical protein